MCLNLLIEANIYFFNAPSSVGPFAMARNVLISGGLASCLSYPGTAGRISDASLRIISSPTFARALHVKDSYSYHESEEAAGVEENE